MAMHMAGTPVAISVTATSIWLLTDGHIVKADRTTGAGGRVADAGPDATGIGVARTADQPFVAAGSGVRRVA
jgi:hypothetical protein